MKNTSTAEFQKQYKQYTDALYATKMSEKGGGYAGVELQASSFEASPSIADKTSAQKVSVPEAEVSVPGAAAEEPVCVSVPWSGDVNGLFEQMDLGGVLWNGDSEVERGLAAATLNCGSETGCCCVSLDSNTSQWCDMSQMLQSSVNGCCCATLLPGCDFLACGDGQALIASALVAEPIRQQPVEGFTAMLDEWFEMDEWFGQLN